MSKTVVRKNESLDDALRRFKRTVSKTGTLQEARKREFYEKPSVRRKKKSEAARKRKFYSTLCIIDYVRLGLLVPVFFYQSNEIIRMERL